jgi:hypothetical protein
MRARTQTAVALITSLVAAGAVLATSGTVAAAPKAGRAAVATSADHGRQDLGFINAMFTRDGQRYLRFDRAVMLTGREAAAAKSAHGIDPTEPPDYYIQNDNPKLRTYRLARDVKVIGSQVLAGRPQPTPVTLQRLVAYLNQRPAGSTYPPFTLTFRKGVVTAISEVYLP